jgi:hypothetical protein
MIRSHILTLSLTTLLLLGLLFCPGNIAFAQNGNGGNDDGDQQNSKLCPTQFEATVQSGPDKGLSLTGVLKLNDEGSRVAGVLEAAGGLKVAVQGRLTGNKIQLTFDLGNNQFINGSGQTQKSKSDLKCVNVTGGGTLSGPKAGDTGDWLIAILIIRNRSRIDFDGDGKTDFAVYRPGTYTLFSQELTKWYVLNNSGGYRVVDSSSYIHKIPVPGDYDGDGKTDLAEYDPVTGNWFVQYSTNINGSAFNVQLFSPSNREVDLPNIGPGWYTYSNYPVPGDYDGDGRNDLAVWNSVSGNWYILFSSTGQTRIQQWGIPDDTPVPADYDGDGKTDIAVWRPSSGTWYFLNSATGFRSQQFGVRTDYPIQFDYDGDGRADVAVYRPSEGRWYISGSSTGYRVVGWGNTTDVPVPGDYDGDGRTDIAVWRPSEGNWYILPSSGGYRVQQWGISIDSPISAIYGGYWPGYFVRCSNPIGCF